LEKNQLQYWFAKTANINLKRAETILEQIGTIINFPEIEWSTNYIIEQTYLDLISATAYDSITRIYEQQVKWYIRRAPIWNPPPVFIVFRKHLSKRVKQELAKLQKTWPKTLDYVMRRSIEMLFEGITIQDEEIFYSQNYFLSSKRYNLLQWRFDNDNENNNDCTTIKFDINYFEYDNEGREIGRILGHNKKESELKNNDSNRK
jgi:hypothetical protein